ncbi:Chemotaxis regulator-transmits chemoreceptor signals to flagelllar motor components CheY [Pseudoalteromonas luteoviolacea B = ATCC 29581]|nr:Chemotaxis regulator-transmits chemoreceptor signals to flagelllar motor components CheY [Pseudoalteromonas luteoviolacea B = ATCC 29581]
MDHISPEDLCILLIEPSTTQRKAIVKELNGEGISNIDFADSIVSTLEALQQRAPDLIISSLHMPDGSAIELLTKLKNDENYHHIPFMLVSSENRKEELEIFKQSGVVAILPKPFCKAHLGKAINATLDILAPQELELDLYDVQDIRILLVDDSRLARNHIRRVLTNLGAQHITEAEDGAQALAILDEQMFDLIVTDYNMPQVNGQELTEKIRASDKHSHIPVMMVTSEANDAHLSTISQSGVNALCDKPFEPETVKKLLFQLLEQ